MTNRSWTLDVKRDPNTEDHYIQLNEEILNMSGFKIGDKLKWIDNLDGSYTVMHVDMKDYSLLTEFMSVETKRYAMVFRANREDKYVVDMYENNTLVKSRMIAERTEQYSKDCAENWIMAYGEFAK
jgi:hypothetical protein